MAASIVAQANSTYSSKNMKEDTTIAKSASFGLAAKVKDYFQLIKFTLSFMVVFSTVISYLLAPNVRFNLISVLLLFCGRHVFDR
jgi:protoheme IX farnesyltransferase